MIPGTRDVIYRAFHFIARFLHSIPQSFKKKKKKQQNIQFPRSIDHRWQAAELFKMLFYLIKR